MYHWDLDLGPDPWERLTEGPLRGTASLDGSPALPVSVRIRGAHSRRFPKRSLQVTFTETHLTDEPPDGHSVRRVHLNADYIDPTLMRSALSFGLHREAGVPAPLCRHSWLTVSSEPAGVYLWMESVDADFCRRRGWEPGPIYYAINRNANFGLVSPFSRALKQPIETGYQSVQSANPAPLRQMLTEINIASAEAFPRTAERWLDVHGYLRWLMVAVLVGNRDGFVHNYALCLTADRFRIIPWDYDATWGIDIHGRPARVDRVPLTGWNKLSHRLIGVPRFRKAYRNMVEESLATIFAPERLQETISRMQAKIAPWVERDRWGKSRPEKLAGDIRRIHTWALERRAWLQNELRSL